MTKTIWKYPVTIGGDTKLLMQEGAEFIHAGLDPTGEPCVWALLDPNKQADVPRNLLVIGTGRAFDQPNAKFIGSINQGPFMWHVFEEVK